MLALIAGTAWLIRGRDVQSAGAIGLFTTLPILWNEAGDVAGMLKAEGSPHWARAALAARGSITALDTLAAPGAAGNGSGPLAGIRRLVIAQPRPLGPDENVALDDWVRGGGQLLLLADPALTADSAFAVGDPRRPQAVVLLSPILTRWGLELRFDDRQPFGERSASVLGAAVPVNLPGHFAARGPGGCTLLEQGLAAICTIGRGRVVALADAAVLEAGDGDGTRATAFAALLDKAFAAH